MDRNKRITVLAYDRMATFEFSIPVEVFGLPRPYLDPWYEFEVCALERGPLRATGGIAISVDGGLDCLAAAETIILPGWRDLDVPPPMRLLDALREAHDRGARIATICSGSFLLAATGMLDGRRATTHWHYAERMQRQFPKIHVDPNVLFVDEGRLLTSAGSAAGLDLCLHLVRLDYGAAVAAQVAKRLVIYAHRDGGQAQFIDGATSPDSGRFDGVAEWIQQNLAADVSVDDMAERAGLSRRTFIRRFKDRYGQPPHTWLTGERVRRARELLETTDKSVEVIAVETGLGGAATLRHHFRSLVGTSPQSYRRRFRFAA